MHQDWLTRDEQHYRNNENINSGVTRRLDRLQRDDKNTLGSSDPVPIVQDTQYIIQPTSTPITSAPGEIDNEGGGENIINNFSPRRNPRRKATHNVD